MPDATDPRSSPHEAPRPDPWGSLDRGIPGLVAYLSDGYDKQTRHELLGAAAPGPEFGPRPDVRFPVLHLENHGELSLTLVLAIGLPGDGMLRPVTDLQVRGPSRLQQGHGDYDELNFIEEWRARYDVQQRSDGRVRGLLKAGSGARDRPALDRWYPEILEPGGPEVEVRVDPGARALVVVEPGTAEGRVTIHHGGERREVTWTGIALDAQDPPITHLTYLELSDIRKRYGRDAPELYVRHVEELRKYGMATLVSNDGGVPPAWAQPLLRDGRLPIWSIATYGRLPNDLNEAAARVRQAQSWLARHAPDVEHFVYLADEPGHAEDVLRALEERAAGLVARGVTSPIVVTISPAWYDKASEQEVRLWREKLPNVDVPMFGFRVGRGRLVKEAAESIVEAHRRYAEDSVFRGLWMYNGGRPGGPTWVTEEKGTGFLSMIAAYLKHDVSLHFFWAANYWTNGDGYGWNNARANTNVLQDGCTFGVRWDQDGSEFRNDRFGTWGWKTCWGDGVLLYPGTDVIFRQESRGVDRPLPSYRLVLLANARQGIARLLAAGVDLDPMVPRVLMDREAPNSRDPTYDHPLSLDDAPGWEEDVAAWRRLLARV